MRKFTIIALMALCFALPGTVQASSNSYHFITENISTNNQISPELVEKILKYVAVEHGYDFQCLCADYGKGKIEIDKDSIGYRVTLNNDGGSTAIIQILEDI